MDTDKVIKAAGVVGLGTFLSRILGLVRLQVIAYIFGYSAITDAFWIGFTLPNLLRSLLAEGALSAAFIPVFSEWLAKKGEKEAKKLANNVLNILLLLLVAVVGLGAFLAPYYVPYLAFGFRKAPFQLSLAIKLTQAMFPFLLFISLAALAMAFLNCKGHFATPAFAPLLFSVAVILSALFLTPQFGIYSLAVGVVVGGGMQFLFQIPSLIRRGFRYCPALSFKDPGIGKIGKLIVPATLGGITLQVNVLINRVFASTLIPGSISALLYAMRLIQFPLGLFAIALSTAIFPTFSYLAAKEKVGELREMVSLGVRMVLFVLIPSTVGLIIIRGPLISLLFQHGAFLAEDTLMTAETLVFYSLGLFAMGEVMVLTRAFYSLQDIFTPVKVSILVLILNVGLNLLLISPLKHSGLALATSLSMFANGAVLLVLLRRKLERIEGRKILNSFLKISLATAVMGAGVFLIIKAIPAMARISLLKAQVAQVSTGIGLGILIFCGLAYCLKLDELRVIYQAFRRKKS
ncbi:MAG: murein biosynthesis integral membrane protein MurJ [bacterium]